MPRKKAASSSETGSRCPKVEAAPQDELKNGLDELLGKTGIATWQWDFQDDSMVWSPVWYAILGYSPEELPASAANLIRITHPDDLPDTMSAVLNHARGRTEMYQSEQRRFGRQGEYRWILDRGVVRERNAEGQAIRMSGISIDLSDRKRLEEELRSSRGDAERSSRSKTEFIQQVAQQVRSPLNGILGMSSLLLETQLDEKQRRFGELLQRSIRDLTSLFDGVTDFLKIDSGQMMLQPRPFDLRVMLADLRSSIITRVRNRGLTLGWKIEPEVPGGLTGDPGRLKQVLWNLLDNAVKFTDAGQIDLGCSLSSAPDAPDIELRFTVRDTGIGIPKTHLGTLFDAFFHPEAGRCRRFGGLGLGLALSRQIIQLMDGTIEVQSDVGQGTVFSFTCRFGHHPGFLRSAFESDSGNGSRGASDVKKVLVVDENRANRIVCCEALRMFGYQVDGVSSGKEALSLLEDRAFDLVIIDLQMPDSEGPALVATIRAVTTRVRNPGLTIVAMRGKTPGKGTDLPSGVNAVISRPVKLDQLAEILQQWLPLNVKKPD